MPSALTATGISITSQRVFGSVAYSETIRCRVMQRRAAAMPATKHQQPESALLMPRHIDVTEPIFDTHCHLSATFARYQSKYKEQAERKTLRDFVHDFLTERGVIGCVDVWCEPVDESEWRSIVDEACSWQHFDYRFVCGLHPHEAKFYTDELEEQYVRQLTHPRNVGFGEIGLDYHYDHSPRDVQQRVLERQLRLAIRLGKPLTIHTREADADIERILKMEVPREWRIHVHCFTDSLNLAEDLLSYFPNLVIGITGVTTFATNANTPAIIRRLAERAAESAPSDSLLNPLRLVLETDSPYMTPTTLPYTELGMRPKGRLPLNHSGTLPWTAAFAALEASKVGKTWETDDILRASRDNARAIYGV